MLAVLVGGAAVLLSFVGLDWYGYPSSGANRVDAVTFADLAANEDAPGMPGIVTTYFDWLGWVLLILVVAIGATAKIASRSATALGVAGALVGVAGSASTYWAVQEATSFGDEGGYAFQSAAVGLWFALCGFLLAGIGAVIGPRRV
jgi:hypothetical protein